MCGRFTASFEFREIKIRWNLRGDIPFFGPRYNIAPSQEVPVIVRSEDRNELKPMRWAWCRRGRKILRWVSARLTLVRRCCLKNHLSLHSTNSVEAFLTLSFKWIRQRVFYVHKTSFG
jgi:hypothetical protein